MLLSPQRTEHIPYESSVMRLIGVTSEIFEVVSDTTVNIAMKGGCLFPNSAHRTFDNHPRNV